SPETNYPTGTTESPYYPSSPETNYPTGTTESPYYPSSPETNYPTLDFTLPIDKNQMEVYNEKTKNIFERVDHLTIHQHIYTKIFEK
ncbi:hypothetical protein, partial [Bacillus thuringiensis]|uniref:hypothetical protein n=1 Tax=Bacillus thuringiensis TaxID=1428 RepID=UPI0034576377